MFIYEQLIYKVSPSAYTHLTFPLTLMLFILPFILVLFLSLVSSNNAQSNSSTNLDDTSSQITYLPESLWLPSTAPSPVCTNQTQDCVILLSTQTSISPPGSLNTSAFGRTWHVGVHVVPNSDEDDEGGKATGAPDEDGDGPSSISSVVSSATGTSSTLAASSSTPAAQADNEADEQDDEAQAQTQTQPDDGADTKQKGKGKGHRRRWSVYVFTTFFYFSVTQL